MALHEDLHRTHEVRRSSERTFGLVIAVVFALVGLWPIFSSSAPGWWALIIAGVLVVVALAQPRILSPFNRLWTGLGIVMHRVMTPLVMGILFYGAVTPTALLLRLFGKDPLRRRFEPDAETYWIVRDPPGPDPESMRNQF